MNKTFSGYKILIILVFVAIQFALISCSQNTPELSTTDYSVIFDYAGNDELPAARLSIFAASGSDVRRYERLRIKSIDTGLCWETDSISLLENDDVQWAGCTNLVAPEDEKLPVGRYEITYINADEKECTVSLDVRYDVDFYDVVLSGLADYMAEKRGIEKIAIYDKEHILIYFGNRTEEFRTTRDIWNTYREAEYYQVIWYTRDGRVICIEPEKPVTPEAEKKAEETEAQETKSEETAEYDESVVEED